jgi:hypothetical protein
MNRPAWKLALPWLGVLLTATISTVGYSAWAQSDGALHQETAVLQMSWKRGDVHYGPNFIHLESPCLSNADPSCYCSNNFPKTRSKEFADYIESFGSKKVPVKYRVDYDGNHQVVGAVLESVGDWPQERFNIIEKSLGLGFRMVRNQSTGGVVHANFRSPSDCFPKSEK